MPQRLGRAFSSRAIQATTALAPQYDVLLRINPWDLPSGTGLGTDYVIVVMARVGRLSNTFADRVATRIGLRFPAYELVDSVQQVHHLGSPLGSLACNYHAVVRVQDWDLDEPLFVFGSHLPDGPGGAATSHVSELTVLVFDAVRLNGGAGGPRLVWQSVLFPGTAELPFASWANLANTGTISASSGTWVAFYSGTVLPKGAPTSAGNQFALRTLWPATDTWGAPFEAGPAWGARGTDLGVGPTDGRHVYQVGSFVPFEMSSATTSVRLQGRSNLTVAGGAACRIASARIAVLRIDSLDGHYAEATMDRVAVALGSRRSTLADDERTWSLPRDCDNLVVLASTYTKGAELVGSPPRLPTERALRTYVTINRWAETGTAPASQIELLWSPGEPEERIPMFGTALVTSRAAPAGSVSARIEQDGSDALFGLDPVLTYPGWDRKVVAFQLSDYGVGDLPTPPTLTRIVLVPGREVPSLAAVPTFLTPPSQSSPAAIVDSWEEMIPDLSSPHRIRWGAAVSPRRVVRVEWVDIDQVSALLQYQQLTEAWPRTFRWAPQHEPVAVEVPWVLRPGTAQLSASSGGYAISCELIELIYFAP